MKKEDLFNTLQQFVEGKSPCDDTQYPNCTDCQHTQKKSCKTLYVLDTIINAVLFNPERENIDDTLNERLKRIKQTVGLFGDIIHADWKDGRRYVTTPQAESLQMILDLFGSFNWQIKLNQTKELIYNNSKFLNKEGCGTPVKVRPCKKDCEDKTYFGILLGDLALSMSSRITSDFKLEVSPAFYNPAIFVPELNDIIYGCESWWGRIESEEELSELITDDVIKNVWYMKMLKNFSGKKES